MLGAAAYLTGGLVKRPSLLDEGHVVLAAERIMHGEVPYRDFWTLYAPGQFYSLALVFEVFGASLLSARLWDLTTRVALVGIVFVVARVLGAGRASVMPPLLTAVWLGSVNFPNYPMFPALGLGLAAVALLARHVRTGGHRWLAAAGASVGLAAFYRHDVGVYAILALVPAIIASTPGWTNRNAPLRAARAALVRLGIFAAGLALTLGPVATYLLAVVPTPVLWADLVVFPVSISPTVRGEERPPLIPDLANPIPLITQWVPYYLPIALYAAWSLAGAYRLVTGRRAAVEPARRWGGLALLLLGIGLLGQVRIIPDWSHLMPTTIVATIALYTGVGSNVPGLPTAWRRRLTAALAPVLAISYVVVPLLLGAPAVTMAWTGKCDRTLDRAGCASVPPDLADAVRFVRASVDPDRPIFVGNARHDRLVGNDMLFYFLADRPPATGYFNLEPGLATTADVQAEIVAALERKSVTHVVLLNGYDTTIGNVPAVIDAGATMLDNYIRARYRPTNTFGRYEVWEPR